MNRTRLLAAALAALCVLTALLWQTIAADIAIVPTPPQQNSLHNHPKPNATSTPLPDRTDLRSVANPTPAPSTSGGKPLITGVVVSAATGRPISAVVRAHSIDWYTGPDGAFSFPTGDAGHCKARVSSNWHVSRSLTLSPGMQHAIELEPTNSCEVLVSDALGSPKAEASILSISHARGIEHLGHTNQNGALKLPLAGTRVIYATLGTYSSPFAISTPDTQRLHLELSAKPTGSLRTVQENGDVISGVHISLTPLHMPGLGSVSTISDEHGLLPHLPRGFYELECVDTSARLVAGQNLSSHALTRSTSRRASIEIPSAGRMREVKMEPTRSSLLSIRDAEDATPIQTATLSLEGYQTHDSSPMGWLRHRSATKASSEGVYDVSTLLAKIEPSNATRLVIESPMHTTVVIRNPVGALPPGGRLDVQMQASEKASLQIMRSDGSPHDHPVGLRLEPGKTHREATLFSGMPDSSGIIRVSMPETDLDLYDLRTGVTLAAVPVTSFTDGDATVRVSDLYGRITIANVPEDEGRWLECCAVGHTGMAALMTREGPDLVFRQLPPATYIIGPQATHGPRRSPALSANDLRVPFSNGGNHRVDWRPAWAQGRGLDGTVTLTGLDQARIAVAPCVQENNGLLVPITRRSWFPVRRDGHFTIPRSPVAADSLAFAITLPSGELIPIASSPWGSVAIASCREVVVEATGPGDAILVGSYATPVRVWSCSTRATFVGGPGTVQLEWVPIDVPSIELHRGGRNGELGLDIGSASPVRTSIDLSN